MSHPAPRHTLQKYNMRLNLQIFTNEGKYINMFGSRGKDDKKFNSPCGIAADADGHIYVSDFRNNRIHVI